MGIVEKIGPRGVRGWVRHQGETDSSVLIKVNGIEIARAVATNPVPFEGGSRNYGFSRMLLGVWQYLGEGDKVTFEHEGQMLPIVGNGFSFCVTGERQKKIEELFEKIGQGWQLDKRGNLAPVLGKSRKVQLFSKLYDELHLLVQDKLGITLFPIYGTLLGCIREGNFIPHDNDIDVTYISAATNREGVIREYIQLCSVLMDSGYQGVIKDHGFGIKKPIPIDIFPSWVDNGMYNISFGYHGDQIKWDNDVAELVERRLGDFTVKVPKGSEKILSQLYGVNWRIPDPGFSHYKPSRKKDFSFLPTPERLAPLFWKQYYKYNEISDGSSFAKFVQQNIPSESLVIDIGCGTGRDAIFFAAQGFQVVGADAASEGVKQGEKRGLPNCRFVVADAGSAADLRALFSLNHILAAQATNKPVVVYLRFFLHAIPENVEDILLDALFMHLSKGRFAAEFRTIEDEAVPKFNTPHYRRFLDSDQFVKKVVEKYKVKIDYLHKGTGLSVYNGEDPFLCRIIASWDREI